jgi:hypothetical protein
MPDPKPDDVDFHEETDSPTYADDRNFYKVEKWTKDRTKVDRLLYAGNSLGRARSIFQQAIKHRPQIRLTLRQRTRMVDQWPPPPQRGREGHARPAASRRPGTSTSGCQGAGDHLVYFEKREGRQIGEEFVHR